MNGQIFISYRRDDSLGSTGRLYDQLTKHFSSDQVFIDVNTIAPGEDFVEAIEKAVGKCDVLIAVIGKKWLDVADKNGRRMLDNPSDFVRIEICAALKRNIRVIPALVENAQMPNPEDLAEELKPLARRNAIELSHTQFNRDVDRLIKSIQKVLDEVNQTQDLKDQEKRDESLWVFAYEKDTIDSYQEYLNAFPSGNHFADASRKIAELRNLEGKPKEIEAGLETSQSIPVSTEPFIPQNANQLRKRILLLVGFILVISVLVYLSMRDIDSIKPQQNSDSGFQKQDSLAASVTDTSTTEGGEFALPKIVKDNEGIEQIEDKIQSMVEVEAKYPSGEAGWQLHLIKSQRYPQAAQDNNIQGTVVVQFIVDKQGVTSDVKAISGPIELRDEAVRVIKQSGSWTPAIQNGRNVRSYKKQPIVFRLESE